MKYIKIIFCIVLLPLFGITSNVQAQDATPAGKSASAVQLPEWAGAQNYDAKAHVYFPDYYTFYDPARGGYLYWDKDNFTFSPNKPPFLEKVDLAKSRIQILKGLSLDLHPERNYPRYMKLYPANNQGNANVPVPIPGNPAGN